MSFGYVTQFLSLSKEITKFFTIDYKNKLAMLRSLDRGQTKSWNKVKSIK